MTGLDIDLELLAKNNISIDELNIGNWKHPDSEHWGYKEAVSYAVTKDREAREQAIEDSRAKLWEKLTPQQRALLDAVAQQATGHGMLELKDGVDAHLEGLADTWAKHAGNLLDAVIDEPEPNTFSTAQAHTRLNDTSREWPRPPAKVDETIGHRLTNINEEYRRADCAAHGYRVPVRWNGHVWRCAVAHQYKKAEGRRRT